MRVFSVVLSVLALLVSASSVVLSVTVQTVIADLQGEVSAYQLRIALVLTCSDVQSRIFELRDADLSRAEIIRVLNAEELPVAEQLFSDEVETGPGYDVFIRPSCGDIALYYGDQ